MSSTSVTPQIDGLPPGAILKPIQPDIKGLPPGAILRPIEATAAPAKNPYQQAADKIPGGTGTSMSAGTQTYDQAHPKPQAGVIQRFAQGAGIPTSQAETTEAVRSTLLPDADPRETDPVIRFGEQVPILGGDFRARAALAKRAANETGAVSVAHKIASLVPLAGPAVAAAQDEYDKGNYAGAAGAGLNALLSMEGVKGAIKPKAPELPAKSLGQETTEAAARPPANPVTPSAGLPTRTLSNILGGGEKAMAKTPLKGATAAGSASNAEVRSYAASKGIDLLPGQATGAKGLQTVQAVGERTIVAPGELPDVLDKQKAAFGNLVDDFKQRVGTEAIPDTEAAGTSLKSQAQAGLDNLKQSAQQDYQGFQQQAGDIPVDLSDVKAKAAASLASQAEALKNVPAQYANPVRNVLKKLSDLQSGGEVDPKALADFNNAVETYGLNPEQQIALRTKLGLPDEKGNSAVKMSTAQQLRSAYLDISRDYTGNVPKSVQRYASQAAKDIDVAMAKAADQVGATQQWRQANAKWKQLQDTYNNSEHPLYKVLQEPDPSKIPSKLLGKGNYGGSPQTVRQLQHAGIDISPLKREVAQQIADRNFALTNGGRMLAGYSTDFLKTLFAPAEFDELTKMGRVGRAIKFEMNPSGTSNVMEGHRQIHGILTRSAGAVIGPLASRLTTSKAFARATMGGIAPQPRGLLDILGSRGPEPPPETPPTAGTPVAPTTGPVTPIAPKASGVAAAPRSLSDILSGKPTVPVSDKIGGAKVLKGDVPLSGPVSPVAADITRLKAELKTATDPKEVADIQQALEHAQARLEGRPYTPPEQAAVENLPASQPREIEPGTYNRETKVHTPGKPKEPYVAGEKYHQAIPEITQLPPSLLERMNSGEVGTVSPETAHDMKFDEPVQVSVFSDGKIKIVDGHHRVAAAKQLGMDSIPVEVQAINAKGSDIKRLIADQPQAVAPRSLSDILSGKPQEKIDLNAPKSKRKIPPDVIAKADKSGNIVTVDGSNPLPTKQQITQVLADHPFTKLRGNVKRVFVVGSGAEGKLRPSSDLDILLEVSGDAAKAAELQQAYRNRAAKYFMDNNIRGVRDEVHPQWNGRRVDVYFTHDADAESRPKIQLK